MTNQTIMDMYLACYSQEEIAAAVDVPQQTVRDRIASFTDLSNLAKSGKTLANHEEQLRNVTQLENAVFINDRILFIAVARYDHDHWCSRTTLVSAIAQYLR